VHCLCNFVQIGYVSKTVSEQLSFIARGIVHLTVTNPNKIATLNSDVNTLKDNVFVRSACDVPIVYFSRTSFFLFVMFRLVRRK
tara:strand:- start:1320 stop:1571 length:252 start_codon:yes stop_codon:yes gene_type:complete